MHRTRSYRGSCCVYRGMETLDTRQTGARMQDVDIMDLPSSPTPEVEDLLPELDLEAFLEHFDFHLEFNDSLFNLDFDVDIPNGEVAMPTAVAEPGGQKKDCKIQREPGDGLRKRRETEPGDGLRKRRETEPGDGLKKREKRRETEPGDVLRKRRETEPGDGLRKRRETEPGDGLRKRRKTQRDSPIRGGAGSPPLPAVPLSSPHRLLQITPSLSPSLLYIPGFGNATFLSSCRNVSGLQLVQAPLFSFSRPPTYILSVVSPSSLPTQPLNVLPLSPGVVSPSSLPTQPLNVLPLSPVDSAVAPDLMYCSSPGSLSDCASQALSPPSASPISPRTECVEEYIHQAKAHLRGMCQEMEAGFSLASHYVDMRLVKRQILIGSGKNANKCLEKDLVVMGDAERRRGSLARSQVFESSAGGKPKRSIVLLGNAGMGKSTLIKKLCVDWSDGLLPQFDFVFLLDGKALTLPPEPTYSLQSLLLHLSSSPLPSPCPHPQDVFNQVLSVPERVLVIFDGFEVVRDLEGLLQCPADDSRGETYSVRQLFSGLLQRRLLPGCSLLLSARPRGTVSGLLRRADSLLELSGFSPPDIERYLGQYFSGHSLEAPASVPASDPTPASVPASDPTPASAPVPAPTSAPALVPTSAIAPVPALAPALTPSPAPAIASALALALARLHSQPYLLSVCWNPALCHMVCLLLEHWEGSEPLPSTLTGLCQRVLALKMRLYTLKHTHCETLPQTHTHTQTHTQKHTHTPNHSQKHGPKHTHNRTRTHICTRSHTQSQIQLEEEKRREEEKRGKEDEEEEEEREEKERRCVLSELSGLAWQGVKGNSSLLTLEHTIYVRLRVFGLRTGLVHSHWLRGGQGRYCDSDGDDISYDNILSWAHPFLQSFLSGAHLSVSRCVSDRALLAQILPQPRGRRRPQGECLDLAQRFAVGLLFRNKADLRDLATLDTDTMNVVVAKRAAVISHLENLHHGDLSPARLLEACHCVYETGDVHLVRHLVRNLPEVLSFQGVPMCPTDAFVLWNLLDQCRTLRRRFCLGLEDTGLRITGLKLLTGLNNIHSYRACIADTITLWEELEQSGEEELLKAAVSKLTLKPFRATQVSHVQHLSTLVNIHTHRRLSDNLLDGVLGEGIPAVRDLHKLEFELGPVNGPLALPKLLELLPALHSLQHLDLENSKLGDSGAEGLAGAVVTLSSLQIINLSQNCIGDQGIERLAPALSTLPSLHCLSLYSNVISDGGADSLAAVLPQMPSLSDLDVKYNRFTALGAQTLASSLRDCPWIKSLGMWNVCIPYGVLERLQQQDPRIQLL